MWRNGYIVSKLVTIGNAYKKSIGKKRKSIYQYFKLVRLGFKKIDDALLCVSEQAAFRFCIKIVGNLCIETNTAKHAGKIIVYPKCIYHF